LAAFVKRWKALLAEEYFGEPPGWASCQEVGVFIDVCSLHQLPRTSEQNALFREALSFMDVIYAHSCVTVLKMTGLPVDVPLRSDERGWPLFEQSLANAKIKSRIGNHPLYVHELADDFKASIDALSTRSSIGFKPPLTVKDFEWALDKRVFTNGHTDAVIVKDMYRQIFPVLMESHGLMFNESDWGVQEIQLLCKVLPYYKALDYILLDDNPRIGNEGALFLLKTLEAHPPTWRGDVSLTIDFENCGITPDVEAMLPLEANKDRGDPAFKFVLH